MRLPLGLLFCLLATIASVGCAGSLGNNFQASQTARSAPSPTPLPTPSPTPAPTPTPTPAPATVQTLYQSEAAYTAIGYSIDPVSGHLAQLPQPFPITEATIDYFQSLTDRLFISVGGPSACSRYICSFDSTVSTVLRDPTTGTLTPGMRGVLLFEFAHIRPGKFAYSIELKPDETRHIRAFSIDSASGTVVQVTIPDIPLGGSGALIAHPTLPILYSLTAECCAPASITKLHFYGVDNQTAAITEMPESPIVPTDSAFWNGPVISADGAFLYARSFTPEGAKLAAFSLDNNGVPQPDPIAVTALPLTPLSPYQNYSYVVNPNGKLVYVWPDSAIARKLYVYHLDASSGSFSLQDVSSVVPADFYIIGFDASGRYLYMRRHPFDTGIFHTGPIQRFEVDQNTGSLTYAGSEP